MNWTIWDCKPMPNILAPQKKKWLSNLVLLSFLLLVGGTAFLSNTFKTHSKGKNDFIEEALVFNNKELDKVTQLILKNKSGEYSFERADTNTGSIWHMTSPKDLSASSAFIEKLFTTLNTIKTKKLLLDDKTNNSNFSLDKPTAILTLTDEAGKSILLSVGIMNTIDNSTYMKISGRNGIYHVEAPSISLENITTADLIKSTVFEFDAKKILAFKIFKKNSKTPQFEVSKKDGVWSGPEGKALNTTRLEDLLNEFVNLKSSFVLDEQTDAQKKQASTLLSNGEYTVKVTMEDNQVYSYQTGAVTKSIAEVPLSEEPHFIIVENHTPIVYIVKKEFLNLFELKNDRLKSLE
ncbi:MAG: DUF4340 domain-containing protein [Rhizobacter sp.]|nr:DUF4340 domain-containing protein [Bacteriovorax sp.]